uniref:Uncharacterized protein n=1 Tax=Panagrolaimus sp. JU765 TaxID=591449 RepID=A0AC34R8T2_9BILA
MFGLRVTNYILASHFKQPAPLFGIKPCIFLQGTLFESDENHKQLKKCATKTPRVELVECGPSIDCVLVRKQIVSDSLFKEANRIPDQLLVKPRKNLGQDVLGTKHGRTRIQFQLLEIVDKKWKNEDVGFYFC